MEDWNNLFEHALISDASPDFQQWLHHRSGWQWQPPPEQADHPEEALVGGLCRPCRLSLKLKPSQSLKLDLLFFKDSLPCARDSTQLTHVGR